jgi:hypothetical protein
MPGLESRIRAPWTESQCFARAQNPGASIDFEHASWCPNVLVGDTQQCICQPQIFVDGCPWEAIPPALARAQADYPGKVRARHLASCPQHTGKVWEICHCGEALTVEVDLHGIGVYGNYRPRGGSLTGSSGPR